MITFQISRKWTIKTPTVFRYMDQKYIDDFFETGNLRLSTFKTFAEHEDAQRKDTREGINMIMESSDELSFGAYSMSGSKSLILCTSALGNKDLMNNFETNGYFKINDTTQFGIAIANQIAGFSGGLEGFCDYKDRRLIERKVDNLNLDDLKEKKGEEALSMNKMLSKTSDIGGPNVFFVKLNEYSHQVEYRFIWNLMHDLEEALYVKCPGAIQFCEKVT
jgi:hypothetical protein